MTIADGELFDMRCFTCGRLIGHTSFQVAYSTWCNPFCYEVPISRTRRNQYRDEVIIALFLERRTAMQIGNALGISRQNVQSILDKRGVNPFSRYMPSRREEVAS